MHDRRFQVRPPVTQIGDPRLGRVAGGRGRTDRRHDDRRVDRRQPRPGAGRGHHRGLAQLRSGARLRMRRIQALLQNSPLNFDRLRLPRPHGRLTVERVLYVPPPNKKVILNGISFQLDPGESLAIVGASGGRQIDARPHAGRLDRADRRHRPPRHDGPAQLGSAAIRRERRLPAAGRAALPGDHQGQHRPHARRMRRDEAIFDAAELADVHEMISQFAAGLRDARSPSMAAPCRAARSSASVWPAPSSAIPSWSCSTSRTRISTCRANRRWRGRSSAPRRRGITVVAITQRPGAAEERRQDHDDQGRRRASHRQAR